MKTRAGLYGGKRKRLKEEEKEIYEQKEEAKERM